MQTAVLYDGHCHFHVGISFMAWLLAEVFELAKGR
jgi:hypothetical protein